MKKISLVSLVVIICLLTALSVTQAQTSNVNQATIVLPGSSKYFFKQVKNYFQSIFTFKPENKLALKLKLATEKLSEIQALEKNQNSDPKTAKLVTNNLQAYQNIMTKVQTGLTKVEEKNKIKITDQIIEQQIKQQTILNDLSQPLAAMPVQQAKEFKEVKAAATTNLLGNLKNSPNNQQEIITTLKTEASDDEIKNITNTTGTASHFFTLAKGFIKTYGAKARLALSSGLISEEKIIDGAEAGECVAEQTTDKNYSWYMEKLMNNYKSLNANFYVATAEQIDGLNIDQFKTCFISSKYRAQVKSDYKKLSEK